MWDEDEVKLFGIERLERERESQLNLMLYP